MILQEAVDTLVKRGLEVKARAGPQGMRYRISVKDGSASYEIGEAELIRLHDEQNLSWQGVVGVAWIPRFLRF